MMDAYCRTCSGVGDSRLFTLNTVSQISSVRIEDMLINCTQLEISSEDNLPQQICFNCLMSLNSAFEFRKLCYTSDSAFRETLQTTLQAMEIEPKSDVHHPTDQCPADVIIKQECLELDEFTISIIGDIENCSDSDNDIPTHVPMLNEARKKHSCEECDFTTDSANIFKRHKNQKHPVPVRKAAKACSQGKKIRTIYKCGECFFQNYSSTKLRTHQASKGHTKSTTYRGVLPLRKFDERKAYTCPHCGARFGYKENIQKHIQVACRAFHDNAGKIEESKIKNQIQLVVSTAIKAPDGIKFRNEYRCSNCKQAFSARSAHLRHRKLNRCPSAESTRKDNLLPYRCDFCNYRSCRRLNLYRHQIARCKEAVYLDETLEPQHIVNDTLKKVYSDTKAIEKLKLESGEPIFPTEYLTNEYATMDNIGTHNPPIKLIDSVEEFEYFLVIKMRGLRCCACSMFFLDEASLDDHRRTEHISPFVKTICETTQTCENCRLPFYRTDGFSYHKQLEQINRLLFCTTCEMMVIGNTAWLAHCNIHHGKRNLDDSYEKMFIGEKFRCCKCYALKATLNALEAHQMEEHFPERLKDQGAAEYECDKCFTPFETIDQWERHMEVRTAKKFYRCGTCQVEFLLEKDAIAHRDSNVKCRLVENKLSSTFLPT